MLTLIDEVGLLVHGNTGLEDRYKHALTRWNAKEFDKEELKEALERLKSIAALYKRIQALSNLIPAYMKTRLDEAEQLWEAGVITTEQCSEIVDGIVKEHLKVP